jgi:hypothetical protein
MHLGMKAMQPSFLFVVVVVINMKDAFSRLLHMCFFLVWILDVGFVPLSALICVFPCRSATICVYLTFNIHIAFGLVFVFS